MKHSIAIRFRALLLALPLLAAGPVGFSADTAAPATITRFSQAGTNAALFSIDFPNQEITAILAEVAEAAGINLVLADRIQGRTSVKLRNVTWRQIYREVLTPIGYAVIESGDMVRVVNRDALTQPWTPDLLFPKADRPEESRISVRFTDTPAAVVLNSIAKSAHLNFSIPCTLDFPVTVHLTSTTWRQAFRAVLNPHGYTFSEDEFLDEIVTIRPGPRLPDVAAQGALTSQPFSPASALSNWFNRSLLLLSSAVLIPLALLHLVFAVGVARLRPSRPTLFVSKPLWVLFVLGGGIVPLLAYWLMHHSSLAPSAAPVPPTQ